MWKSPHSSASSRLGARLPPQPNPEERALGLLLGRERELSILMKLLDDASVGRRAALIEGETGVGKSALLAEFLDRARSRGPRVLQSACYEMEEAGPYFPIVQILSQAGGKHSSLDELVQRLDPTSAMTSAWRDLSADASRLRGRFLQALTELLLGAIGSSETVVAIEDIHWADLGSLLAVNNLLDIRPRGLTLVCTARTDEPTTGDISQLIRRIEEKSRHIVLTGLGFRDAQQLAQALAEPDRLTAGEVRALWAFTRGNPLFFTEILRRLSETGQLRRSTVREAIDEGRVPSRLAHVVDLRIRHLGPKVVRALSAASVIGQEFSARLLASVLGQPKVDVEEVLESAVASSTIRPSASATESRYTFTHPLFAARLYECLGARRRRELHRRVAEAASAVMPPCLPLEDLARHHALGFGAAGGKRAIELCRAAAERAEAVMAHETAARFWRLALSCTTMQARRTRADLYRSLGWAAWAANRWQEAAEAWETAVTIFEALGRQAEAAQVALALGDSFRWLAKHGPAAQWLERALSLGLQDPSDRARALALLGSIRCLYDEHGGLEMLKEAERLVGDQQNDPIIAFWLSYGFLAIGDTEEAYRTARQGLEIALEGDDRRATGLLAGSLFTHELSRLYAGRARRFLRLVEETTDQNDATTIIRALRCKALYEAYLGRWPEVARLCERWAASVRLVGPYQVGVARLIWAEAQLALGNVLAACREMLRSLPNTEELRPVAAVHLARALLKLGRSEEARILAYQFMPAVAAPRRATAAAGRVVLGEVASALEAVDLSQSCYELLVDENRPLVMAFSPISVQRVLGRLATCLHQWPRAMEHFEAAEHQLKTGGARWELAQTHLNYAAMRRARRRSGDLRKAIALELEANSILSDLGMGLGETPPSKSSMDGNRFGLTGREIEVLSLVSEGRRDAEIAQELTISRRTVGRHLENILGKMNAKSRTEAVVLALREGVIGPVPQVTAEPGTTRTSSRVTGIWRYA